ncbi:MAG: hypothetical protein KAH01_06385 [Caldisericia bacterium]|nr:hypothetical protein [Caldisericia bacterium]
MKMIEYLLVVFLIISMAILPGCQAGNNYETSLSDKQLEVNTFNGNSETVFFLRSKNFGFTSFIEESPVKNIDRKTMYYIDYSISQINEVLPHMKENEIEDSNFLNTKSKILYQNSHKEIFYIYPENSSYIFCKDSLDKDIQQIGKIRISSSKKPLMWNPLNLFSWKIFINKETGLVDYYDMETNTTVELSMNTLPKQVYETNNYLLMTSKNKKSILLCNRNSGSMQTVKYPGIFLGSCKENDIFVFSNVDGEIVFFSGNSPDDHFLININGYKAKEVIVKMYNNRLLLYIMSKDFFDGVVNNICFVDWDTNSKKYNAVTCTLLLPNPEAKKITYSVEDSVDLSFFVIHENGCPYSLINFNPIEEYLTENIFKYSVDYSKSRINVSQVQKTCNSSICWSMMVNDQKDVKKWTPIFCYSKLPE